MSIKLITIKDEEVEDNFVPTQRIRKIYDLMSAINVDAQGGSLPEIYSDLDDNAALCGAPEIPISMIVQTSDVLNNVVNEYKKCVTEFEAKVKEVEARAAEAFNAIIQSSRDANIMLSPQIDYVRFRDQAGNARIAVIGSKAKEDTPVMRPEPKMIEHVES